MSHLPKEFQVDLLQLLNIALQERRDEFAKATKEEAFFIHSPSIDKYEVRSLTGPIAIFHLGELQGCCGVVVSYHSEVDKRLRDKGVGGMLVGVRMDAARRKGYGMMVATVLTDNQPERKILQDNGWVPRGEFRNPKTNNTVVTYTVNL